MTIEIKGQVESKTLESENRAILTVKLQPDPRIALATVIADLDAVNSFAIGSAVILQIRQCE